jgi:hypothetical protein
MQCITISKAIGISPTELILSFKSYTLMTVTFMQILKEQMNIGSLSTLSSSVFAHCISLQLRAIEAPSDSDFSQKWKPGTDGENPLLFLNDPEVSFRSMNHRHSTHDSAFDKPVELHW